MKHHYRIKTQTQHELHRATVVLEACNAIGEPTPSTNAVLVIDDDEALILTRGIEPGDMLQLQLLKADEVVIKSSTLAAFNLGRFQGGLPAAEPLGPIVKIMYGTEEPSSEDLRKGLRHQLDMTEIKRNHEAVRRCAAEEEAHRERLSRDCTDHVATRKPTTWTRICRFFGC